MPKLQKNHLLDLSQTQRYADVPQIKARAGGGIKLIRHICHTHMYMSYHVIPSDTKCILKNFS